MELWRRAACVETWRRRRHRGIGALEMRCSRVDVDISSIWRRAARVDRSSELWRCVTAVGTSMYGALEL